MSRRTRLYLAICCVSGLAMAVFAGTASGGVVGSKHDLTTATGGAYTTTADTDEICVFCHTPHGSSDLAPLWNRATDAAGFTMYSSDSLDMTIAAAPQGVSLACLSCHDGTIGYDNLVNAPTNGDGYNFNAAGAVQNWTFTDGSSLAARGEPSNVGKNLGNDHPVSVTYDNTRDTAFVALADAEASGMRFYGAGGDQVECASCHNVHDDAIPPFLRASNSGSALCLSCHIK